MDVKDYRKAYEAEVAGRAAAKGGAAAGAASPRIGAAVALGNAVRRQFAATRTAAAGGAAGNLASMVPDLIKTLLDGQLSSADRLAALKTLSAAAFLGEQFAPYRVDLLNSLREIVKTEDDTPLREAAVAALAAEKDPDIQAKLREGLHDAAAALVSPATALQLLSFDDHASVADLARDIFHRTVDLATKEAALRILSTDPKSQDLLTGLMQDKTQDRSVRALSATGLNFLNPQKFAEVAQEIVRDVSDFEDIRASALGALASTPLHHVVRQDGAFLEAVKHLSAENPLKNLQAAAGRFLTKP